MTERTDNEEQCYCDPSTLERAQTYIPKMKSIVLDKLGFELGEPDIEPTRDGSVDVHWEDKRCEVLLNVRPDGSASYYGDDYKNNKIKGEL